MVVIEKNKSIISKIILKKPKVGNKVKVKIKTSEVEVNFRWGFNIYRYDIIDNIRWILANIFFEDLIKIKQY